MRKSKPKTETTKQKVLITYALNSWRATQMVKAIHSSRKHHQKPNTQIILNETETRSK